MAETKKPSVNSQALGPQVDVYKDVLKDTTSVGYNLYQFSKTQGPDLYDKFRSSVYLPMLAAGTWDSALKLIRDKGLSASKDTTGNPTLEDVKAIQKLVQTAVVSNTDPRAWMSVLESTPSVATKGATGPDTTPKYSKQISTALKLMNADDAQQALSDEWYKAFGTRPDVANVSDFMNKYNLETQKQEKTSTSTTESYTTYQPRKDKSGKQVYDANGQPVYDAVTQQRTTTQGLGFTAQEQAQFLADYLSSNFGATKAEDLAGNSKKIYDAIVGAYKNNYADMPDFNTIAGTIKGVLDKPDQASQNQAVEDYVNKNIRSVMAKKYAGISQDLMAGADAGTFIKPLVQNISSLLETQVDANDQIIKNALNFSDGKGGFRVANDNELMGLVRADSRYANTAGAVTDMTKLAERLAQRLGR